MDPATVRKSLGVQAVVFVALGCGLWVYSGRELSAFVSVTWREIGLGLAIGLGLIAIMAVLVRALPAWGEKLVRLQADSFTVFGYPLRPKTMVFIAICAGVGEEALFRAGLQTFAADHLSIALAVVLASIPFTLLHASKPLVAVAQFGISCLLGFAYFATGSVLAVMIGHALYDVFALWNLQRELERLDLVRKAEEDPDPETEQE